MNNPGIIIQARTDSERLPKKVLESIVGKPILWHIIKRLEEMKLPIVVTTTKRKIDQKIVEIAKDCNVNYFLGETDDVLDRYYQTAKKFRIDPIIRVTADCPLIDPKQSKLVLNKLQKSENDLVGLGETYPDGLDTECFTFDALENSWINAKLKSEREHVTPYIKNAKNGFKTLSIEHKINLHNERWTVDYPEDLEFIKKIFEGLYKKNVFYMKEILEFLEKNPDIKQINSQHKRNEGYEKSIKNDYVFE